MKLNGRNLPRRKLSKELKQTKQENNLRLFTQKIGESPVSYIDKRKEGFGRKKTLRLIKYPSYLQL